MLFARELASRGHLVQVYCSLANGRCTDVVFQTESIVHYYDRDFFHNHSHSGVLIAFKDPESLYTQDFDQRFVWTADPTRLTATQRKLCDGLVGIGPWHEHELKCDNVGYRLVSFITPGVDREDMFHVERIPKQCLYASSPDRGLDFLKSIWPEVLNKHPDATLVVTYSHDSRRTNEEMLKLYRQSDILAYPCLGQERYCITAIKAQMYGTIPCVIPHMALQHTVQFGKKFKKKDYLDGIIQLLDDDSRQALREDMMQNVDFSSWSDVVDQWETKIGQKNQDQSQDK